ncbi:MAG: BBP7 family outer membrane beta-barrel protein [Planctomycetes bacterium]|nr:BBP7 family outer membrane beta-barrel protein [Planctomycetota bacterium]
MRRLYIGLLLMAIPWATQSVAQDHLAWTEPDDDEESLIDQEKDWIAYNRWSVSAEFLMWWTKDTPCPVPLASTAPASAQTNPADSYPPGNLSNPDTVVVLGGGDIPIHMQPGGRFNVGLGLGDEDRYGVEMNFLFLGNTTREQTVTSNGSQDQFLTTPYNAVDSIVFPAPGTPYANFLAGPASFNGSLSNAGAATLTTQMQFYGGELNGLWNLTGGNGFAWHLLGGYRLLSVNERLYLETTQLDNNNFTGQFINTLDKFKTQNYFNGGQLGIRGDWRSGNWYIGGTFKLALGSTHEVVTVSGSTTTNTGAHYVQIPVTTVPFGTYAQPTNIGTNSRDQFALLPEFTLRVGMQLAPSIRYFVGYNFLYLSNLVRPGNQIDGTINPLQTAGFNGGLPASPNGGGRPAPLFVSSDFWAQGLTFGAEIGW